MPLKYNSNNSRDDYLKEKETDTAFIRLLKRILAHHNLSEADFARKVDISKSTATKMLHINPSSKKPYTPSNKILAKISLLFPDDVSFMDLIVSIDPGLALLYEDALPHFNNADEIEDELSERGLPSLSNYKDD